MEPRAATVNTFGSRRDTSGSTSTHASAASSVSGEAFQTPDTSAINSPPTGPSLRKRVANNKRKRTSAAFDTSRDESIARVLQDVEDAGPSLATRTRRRGDFASLPISLDNSEFDDLHIVDHFTVSSSILASFLASTQFRASGYYAAELIYFHALLSSTHDEICKVNF